MLSCLHTLHEFARVAKPMCHRRAHRQIGDFNLCHLDTVIQTAHLHIVDGIGTGAVQKIRNGSERRFHHAAGRAEDQTRAG